MGGMKARRGVAQTPSTFSGTRLRQREARSQNAPKMRTSPALGLELSVSGVSRATPLVTLHAASEMKWLGLAWESAVRTASSAPPPLR